MPKTLTWSPFAQIHFMISGDVRTGSSHRSMTMAVKPPAAALPQRPAFGKTFPATHTQLYAMTNQHRQTHTGVSKNHSSPWGNQYEPQTVGSIFPWPIQKRPVRIMSDSWTPVKTK